MRAIRWLLVVFVCSWAWAQTGVLDASDPQLGSGEYYDLYTHISAATGGLLTIDLRSTDFDVYVVVLDPAGQPLAEFDDTAGLGTDLRETLTLPGPGAYTIAVTSAFPGEVGRYTLSLSEAPALSKGTSPPPATPPAPAAPAPATPGAPAQPGSVSGRVLGADGRPISVPGAKVTVSIYGVSYQSGQNVSFHATPGTDGEYAQRVADGSYRVTATVELNYDGQAYRFDLEPVGGSSSNRDSAGGISQDFVWRIQGLIAGRPAGSTNANDYLGISVAPRFQSVFSDRNNRWITIGGPDARVIFTLTPTAPLIDGSRGQPLTLETDYDPLFSDIRSGLLDVPIGIYEITGVEVDGSGRVTPLLIWDFATRSYGNRGVVRFTATFGGAWPPSVWFTRPD
jgi:hypothetical protein